MFAASTITARLRAIALCPCLPVGLHGLTAMLALLATTCAGRYMQSTFCSAYVQEISDMDALELSLTATLIVVVLSTGGAFAAAYRTARYVAHRPIVLALNLASLVFTLAANASLANSYASNHVCGSSKHEVDLEVRALCSVNCDALRASSTMAVFVAMTLFVSLIVGTYQHSTGPRLLIVESAGTPTTKFELMETPRMTDDVDESASIALAVPLDAPTKAV
ncbi:hypothetical protein SPRG_18511 [Saprolegnia parasitica CBS 223.65]|uniref:Uncharacterized protein n=1 Tax=Saprolegnia parasitica (strain CBS 223.65) TaxID=695850 RepID=A0A067BC55_SAPPC|nr:hypothetical protein SPRG_18511 [Saprolegnia parasitica CBS 223.65]KDO15944.1 hypothetical protein SPRG_18511 [Saprolegnia parasitica CBS 223.65]|eukprot:XP_012213349.1 hypothetical protein SPRG_18511 [Saprolegnia parasitica CBS 223.65]